MNIAKVNNQLVDIEEALYEMDYKTLDFICPHCENKLLIRHGNCKVPHFAHKSGTACYDDYDYNNEMSEWHKYCQSLFPKQYREKSITAIVPDTLNPKDKPSEWWEETHIADICIGNYIIEFQHSPISIDDFDDRTIFYLKAGYKLIWVFDFNEKDIEEYDFNKWIIKYPPKSANYWNPKKYINNLALCFSCCDDEELHRICWARPSNDVNYGYDVDWSRVCTKPLFNNSIENVEDMANFLLKKYTK